MHLMNGTDHSGSLTLCMKEIGSIMNGWGPLCVPPSFSEHGHSCSNIVRDLRAEAGKGRGEIGLPVDPPTSKLLQCAQQVC